MSGTCEPILFVLPTYSGGGAERITLKAALALHSMRPVLVVGLLEGGGTTNLPVPCIGLDCRKVSQALRPLVALIQRSDASIVVSTLKHVTLLVSIAQVLARRPVRHVVRVANTYSQELKRYTPARRLLWRIALTACHTKVAQNICVSAGVANDLKEEFRVAADKCSMIENPVDIQSISTLANEPSAILGSVPPDNKLILGVGRLTPQKDFESLIKAFRRLRERLPSTCLMILGEGPERARLQSLAAELGLGNCVLLPGWVENPYPIYRRADLFVLSSRFEGMPNVLLEALAFDLPIVATDCQSGPREILVEPRLGSLVPVGDWTRMAHAMTEALLAGKDPYRRNYVAERFEISAVMRRYQSAILGPP